MNILFVCTGNTCRSPMAEALARALLKENNKDWVTVKSRGLAVGESAPAAANAISVMAEYGLDLKSHRAAPMTAEDFAQADLILTMTRFQKAALLSPTRSKQIMTLREFAGLEGDIADPYGGSLEDYRQCAEDIYNCLLSLPFSLAVD